MTSEPHRFAIEIQSSDIDELGHVNNAIYLTWVQRAVVDHWRSIATAEEIAGYRWVAISHEITYRRPALLNDAVVANVVLERVRRESAYYHTRIERGANLLAEAKSRWCCLDAQTLRPARVPPEIIKNLTPMSIDGSKNRPYFV